MLWAVGMPNLLRAAEPVALRVMSFNIRYANNSDGLNAWPLRRELLLQTIRAYDPDLLGMQEVVHLQGEYLQENLPAYKFVGVGRDDGRQRGEYSPVMFRASRFELLDSGTFWLSEHPETVGSKSWDASLPRIATWCKLRDHLAGDAELFILNTHFDHIGVTARHESAKLIAKWLGQHAIGLPVIVTGDFNCDDRSDPYRSLLGTAEPPALVDSFREIHVERSEREASFHGFRGTEAGTRIDWILHGPQFKATAAAIDRSSRSGRYPSDHFPVTAELQYRPHK